MVPLARRCRGRGGLRPPADPFRRPAAPVRTWATRPERRMKLELVPPPPRPPAEAVRARRGQEPVLAAPRRTREAAPQQARPASPAREQQEDPQWAQFERR